MTRDRVHKEDNAGGDIQPEAEGTGMTDKRAKEMNALPGRGAYREPGAHPSEEFIEEHTEGMAEQGPDLLDPTKKQPGES